MIWNKTMPFSYSLYTQIHNFFDTKISPDLDSSFFM